VLDLGCGTGRIESCIAKHPQRGQVDIAAVDFSGHMLRSACAKLSAMEDVCRVTMGRRASDENAAGRLTVTAYRATAEHLDTFRQRYDGGFDLAILGFGFLSYVRYGHVLPPAVQTEAKSGLAPLMKDNGMILFSVYNEESAIYHRVDKKPGSKDQQDLPIAAVMELDSGRLRVGEGRYFECEAFTKARMSRLLAQAGFASTTADFVTFPTLHLALDNSQALTFAPDAEFCGGRFDPRLYAYDKQISKLFEDQGHYIVGQATKKMRQL